MSAKQSEEIDRIAADCWDYLHPCSIDSAKKVRGVTIIKAACEKAVNAYDSELKPFKVNLTMVIHERNWIEAWDFVERKLEGCEVNWVEETED